MACSALLFLLSLSIIGGAAATVPRKLVLVQPPPLVLSYHNGLLLKGNLTLHLLWYGGFSASQKAIITDFVRSLTPSSAASPPLAPSVATWWRTTERYRGGAARVSLGRQLSDTSYSLGKSLTDADIQTLAQRGPHRDAITAVLTAPDVTVTGFCMSRCGTHATAPVPTGNRKIRFTYLWVGNSATQCPGQCAWPFHQPAYGPQGPPLVSPNGDVGVDGMIINLATVLAGAVTNPDGKGYFQGPATAPLEAVTACTGAFGKGAYPGYPGDVAVDRETGASYNAHGLYGREYLLPSMWDPKTSQCSTLV